jgi:DNA (cytosine-5)-methyltransferase 1
MKSNVDTTKNRTILSLCTGYGGLERGIEAVIGECFKLAYVEIEAFAVANLVNKMETGKLDPVPICTDLKTFDAKPFRGCVDILTGGYPCQPFSAAGKRNGEDDPRHLWPYIRTIIMDCKPRQCFLENVEGHLTLGISEVLSDLEAMGYRSEVGIFSATEVGAPHQRKRVFILADSSESGAWDFNGQVERKAGIEVLRQGDRAKRSIRSDSTGSVVADSSNGSSNPGAKRTGRKAGPDIDRRSERSELGNSQSHNERWLPISTMHREGVEIGGSSFNGWPSRPGEPQHDWEEPRVVADTENLQRESIEWSSENGILQQDEERLGDAESVGREKSRQEQRCSFKPSSERQTKPKLGRTTNGPRNRVDRLRLLGNGLVPQTAAKAYLTLWRKLNA